MGAVGSSPLSEKQPKKDKMKVALTVICLFGLALADPRQGLNEKDTEMVNKMMDVIDSSLERDADADEKARALFISLTLTSTTTNLATAIITTTSTASCVSNAAGGAFTECTEGSGSGARAADFIVDHIIGMSDETMDGEYMAVEEDEEFQGNGFEGEVSVHKVVNGKSQKVSASEIMPIRTQRNVLNVDYVVNADETSLQSGSMSWSEASVDKAHKQCGRSDFDSDKRARILALANEVVTKDLTSTSTVTETAAATVTFSVGVACTSSGFTFAAPLCTAR